MTRRTYAEELQIVNRFRQQAPVDVEALGLALGLDVQFENLPTEVSGYLALEAGEDHYSIIINKHHPKTRQRFTMAHEIGHYMLHRAILGRGLNDTRAYRTSQTAQYYNDQIRPHHETEANAFAANVLMPVDLICELRNQGLALPAQLAERLLVSQEAIRIRLEGLEKFRRHEAAMFGDAQ